MANEIRYCDKHWADLVLALQERNLRRFMSSNDEEFHERLTHGQMDVTFEASTQLTTVAINLFGTDEIRSANGCPACAFEKIIPLTADSMARKYNQAH